MPMLKQLADSPPSPAKIKSLQRQFGNDLSRDLLTAASLQRKAREKFGVGTWWVTEKSLQQATPWQVARVKSQWFTDLSVYDLCNGIGGDTLQLAGRGPVVGIDSDRRLVSMAAANLGARSTAAVVCADVRLYPISPAAAIHIDPDRRSDGRRSSRPESYSPSWSEVCELVGKSPAALIKLAPAASLDRSNLPENHCVFISLRGSVREQSLLLGNVRENFLAIHGLPADLGQSALIVDRDGHQTVFAPSVPSDIPADIDDSPGEFMIDPDAAIRAAGLTDAFAIQYGLSTLGGPAGFLTLATNAPPPKELAITERVLWIGSSDDRQLRRELRLRDFYPQRIKSRGVEFDPARLQKRLRNCGEQPITLWIGRNGPRQYAVITDG